MQIPSTHPWSRKSWLECWIQIVLSSQRTGDRLWRCWIHRWGPVSPSWEGCGSRCQRPHQAGKLHPLQFFLLIGERIYRIDLVILIIHIIICNINLLFCTASVCSRLMDGRCGLVYHRLLCRPPCHLQRRKVADQHFGGNLVDVEWNAEKNIPGAPVTGTPTEQEIVFSSRAERRTTWSVSLSHRLRRIWPQIGEE